MAESSPYVREAQRVHRGRPSIVRWARKSSSVFSQYVIRDEETGHPIRLSPTHKAWHQLCDEHRNILIWSHVESGKTWQMLSRVLWEIGLNPNSRWIVLSNTKNQAAKWISTLKDYIEKSDEVREVFPKLRRGNVWGEYRFTVDRTSIAKDPTVQAAGTYGNVMGSRADGVILDDVLDLENTMTKDQRDKLWKWLKATIHGRLTRKSVVRVIGTAFHPADVMHRYARQQNFSAFRYPAIDDDGNPRWPERFPLERIEEKRVDLGPIEFARQMMCVARDDSTARFKQEWIDRCLALGNGKNLCSALKTVPAGYRVITGVDLAVSKSDAADLTAFFTLAVRPDGKREVLSIESGKWSGPEIVKKVFDVHERYQSIIIVENNAAQDFILQFARDRGSIPIRPFTTGRNKAHPEFGVGSIAAEMSAGAWVIPNHDKVMHPEVAEWVDEMLYYDPRAHTGDRLMASWFAREGVRLGAITAEAGRLDLMRR